MSESRREADPQCSTQTRPEQSLAGMEVRMRCNSQERTMVSGKHGPEMRRPFLVLCLLGLLSSAASARPLAVGDVIRVLKPLLTRHAVPALGGAIVTSQGLQAIGVVGVRRSGTAVPVTAEDRWHLGSDTKAMTATMLGTLVEERKLRWNTTVGEVFGSQIPELSASARSITLLQLLQHRSGLPKDLDWHAISPQQPIRDQRLQAARTAFTRRLAAKRGSYLYSNLGYVIAASMAEQRTGQTWEALMESRVFGRLGMTSVGYGPVTGRAGAWGHDETGRPVTLDNPPVIGPAGRVHCSLSDWSRFVSDQLKGARGERALLEPQTYRTLQTPPAGAEDACGWQIMQRAWGGRILTHDGSNNLNYSVAWLSPERDFAVLLTANRGGTEAAAACDEAAGSLIEAWLDRSRHR